MTTTIALFNNKGGVGKTTLAYHLAHMLARLGHRTLAADLDPQANLTSAFFDEDRLAGLWDNTGITILTAVEPIIRGIGDIEPIEPTSITERLWLLPGNLGLSRFEDKLSEAWPKCFGGDEASLRATSAFHRVMRFAAEKVDAELVVVDVGPNLGAINRAALLASDHLVVPLAADLFSLQGLRNLGPTLRDWRRNWRENTLPKVPKGLDVPRGDMSPMGYVILQHAVRLDRPVKAYQSWLERIRPEFYEAVLAATPVNGNSDPYELATLRNYRSLMPLAQDARKPMFELRAADGALGSTGRLVQICFDEFRTLAEAIATKAGVPTAASQF